MSADSPYDPAVLPFSFLDGPGREQAIRDAVAKTNDTFSRFAIEERAVYVYVDNRDRANLLRAFFVGHLTGLLRDMPGIEFRNDNGAFFVVLDGVHVFHVKKLDKYSLLGRIPNALLKPQNDIRQEPLPLGEDFEEMPPLSDLYDIVLGYVKDEAGLITSIYFNDQEGQLLIAQRELDLSQATLQLSRGENRPVPETTFTLKSDQDKEEKVSSE